jgi:hypothetical protein
MTNDQVPQDILNRIESRRAKRERPLCELKAMTKEERLEACRAFVSATLERGDNLVVVFYPPWSRWAKDGECIRGHIYGSSGSPDRSKPEPALNFQDFTRDELVAILKPMGKVDDWRDKVQQSIVALISTWNSWEDDAGTKDETYEQTAGKRLNKARLALGMDINSFYAPAGMIAGSSRSRKRTAFLLSGLPAWIVSMPSVTVTRRRKWPQRKWRPRHDRGCSDPRCKGCQKAQQEKALPQGEHRRVRNCHCGRHVDSLGEYV